MMSKKKIEEDFLGYLIPLIEKEGFLLVKKQLTGSEHLVVFEKQEGNVRYVWSLYFLKYGRVDVFFKVYFNETTLLLKNSDTHKVFDSEIFLVDLRTYTNPANKGDYSSEGSLYETPHSNDLMNGINIEDAAKGVFMAFFKMPIPKLTERLGSLEKADKLLNNEPTVEFNNKDFNVLIYSATGVSQLLSSLLVAKATNNPSLPILGRIYMDFINTINPDGRPDIVALKEIIPSLIV
ncbi:MAG: hypothetical protein J7604_22745 [Sporocytophaga sp.]|uniref:hypothetical protein n=1 Tax=Sporocytophaga sp. TaxID=2231183 RepID=UPI001B203E87|nr:hypothetical protein [Sporocytophaga sp.]MBO9703051.1 hypothetical protein [Sporocytophaga sp.]